MIGHSTGHLLCVLRSTMLIFKVQKEQRLRAIIPRIARWPSLPSTPLRARARMAQSSRLRNCCHAFTTQKLRCWLRWQSLQFHMYPCHLSASSNAMALGIYWDLVMAFHPQTCSLMRFVLRHARAPKLLKNAKPYPTTKVRPTWYTRRELLVQPSQLASEVVAPQRYDRCASMQ